MALAQGRFRRDQRIRKRSEYRSILNSGIRVTTPHCVFVVASRAPESEVPHPRLGLIVSRKVGIAVLRNRFKRLARETFRKNQAELPGDAEIVVIARQWSMELREASLREEWAQAQPRIFAALARHRSKTRATRPAGAQC